MCNSLSHSIFQDFVHIIIVSKNLKYNLSKLANLSITPPFQMKIKNLIRIQFTKES